MLTGSDTETDRISRFLSLRDGGQSSAGNNGTLRRIRAAFPNPTIQRKGATDGNEGGEEGGQEDQQGGFVEKGSEDEGCQERIERRRR